MITCPKCGTANRDGSRSCSKCGAALSAPAERRCPMCGTINPPGNVSCSSCGARLVPMTSQGGAETPPGEAEVPEWLARLAPAAAPAQPPRQEPAVPVPPTEASGSDDWLSRLRGALPEQPAEPPPTGSTVSDEEVPDWLRGVQVAPTSEPDFDLATRLRGAAEPPPATVPTAPPLAEAVPDWLTQLAPAATPAQAPPVPAPVQAEPSAPAAPPPAEVPDWLAQLERTAAPAQAPGPSAPAAPPPAEVPDWLAQLAPSAAPAKGPEPSVPAAPPPAEAPDWLAQLAPTAAPTQAPAPPTPVAPPSAEAEVPDWLAQLAPTATPARVPEPFTPAAEPEMPEWLKGLAAEPSAPSAPSAFAGAPFAGEQAPAATETPAWLKDTSGLQAAPTPPVTAPKALVETPEWLKEPEPSAAAPSEAAAPFVEPLPSAAGEMPAWLKELEPSEAGAPRPSALGEAPSPLAPSESVGPTPAPAPGEGGLVAAQLPSWLEALRPKELAPAAVPEEEPAEAEGVLAGLRGALPATAIAWQPLGAGISMRPQITPDDLARAGALQELLARGATVPVRPEGEGRARRLWGNTQRLIVFIVIAVAAIVPLFPGMGLGLVGAPELGGAGDKMFQSIDGLSPGDPVLVAFDYDATQSPEMDVQARAVMRHLLTRKARVSIISLYPAGPAAAQVVISETSQLVSSTVPVTVTHLGYRPGQAVAVASILDTMPVSRVIELAATPDTLRWWAEQLAARPGAPVLLAGVSAQAEPMSQPYLQSQQVKGMMAGVRDAVAYELRLGALKKEQEQQVLAPLEPIATANVALIGLILVGGLIQLVSGGGSSAGDGRRRK